MHEVRVAFDRTSVSHRILSALLGSRPIDQKDVVSAESRKVRCIVPRSGAMEHVLVGNRGGPIRRDSAGRAYPHP